MNIKLETERDFLRLQKVLRELRFLRWNHLTNPDFRTKLEEVIGILGPISDELKLRLDKMQKPDGEYDI